MRADTKDSITRVYAEAQNLAKVYSCKDVCLLNEYDKDSLQAAYAEEINHTNQYLLKQRDLQFVLSWLTENKLKIVGGTAESDRRLNEIKAYEDAVKSLLEVYKTILLSQKNILTYYEKVNLLF